MSELPTTGPLTAKSYRCTRCGHMSQHSTNHWGDIYPRCPGCSWRNPMQPQAVLECMEPVPSGFAKPKPWKHVRLGDLIRSTAGIPARTAILLDERGQEVWRGAPADLPVRFGSEEDPVFWTMRQCVDAGTPIDEDSGDDLELLD